MRKRNPFKWRAPHHLYLGLFLVLVGYLSAPYYPLTTLLSYIFGIVITLDDVFEHTISMDSPLRLLAEKLNFFWLR